MQTLKDSPIPGPKPDPILGNVKDIDPNAPVQSLMKLAKAYGPIFKLSLPGAETLFISSRELADELCDESRFDKKVSAPLEKIRSFSKDGLFTAYTHEPNWEKAHRILVPAFGPGSIKNMFDPMYDIAEQLVLKWERLGENVPIEVSENMTQLTLDTIALCAFDFRFNSFYQNEMHPFVHAMVRALKESGARTRRLSIQTQLMLLTKRQYDADIRYLHKVSDDLIAERKAHPTDKKDLLNLMLQGRDPLTGEGLSDENIRYQMVTFLIAGHETTSGLLSLAIYELLKNPKALQKIREEVDSVLGSDTPRYEHLARLKYVDQVLKETLRIWPTAPAISFRPYEDTVIGGKYPVKTTDTAFILIPSLHRDTTVWGEDVESFRPERFEQEAYDKLPPNSWKPFGNGQRACIGRPFAMQEAQLVLAMILQRFDLLENDPSYQLKIKETLTLKPDQFFIRVRKRKPSLKTTSSVSAKNTSYEETSFSYLSQKTSNQTAGSDAAKTPLLVLFGSNSGSAESFAEKIASNASYQGYSATIGTMDKYTGRLPKEGAVVVVTASYEGQPTDNGKQFVHWLESLSPGDLNGVRFCVFGCGNRDWARTYQAIPKKVDEKLSFAGAERILERGEADARGDFFGDFDSWYETFWTGLSGHFGKQTKTISSEPNLKVEVIGEVRSSLLKQSDLGLATILENRELVDMSSPMGRSKRHIRMALPQGMRYRAGDYLTVLPSNPFVNVERALKRFGLHSETQIVIRTSEEGQTHLPTGYPVKVGEVLLHYPELSQPATKKQVEILGNSSPCPPEKNQLLAFAKEDSYAKEILEKRVSVLDLLERYASCMISFGDFLEMLPPLKARQYSISSSPLGKEDELSLTVAIVDAPAWSGQGRFQGVSSHHLSQAGVGSQISVSVRPSQAAFHLPEDLETPVIMVCAGTGLAPFRGFIEERGIQAKNGRKLGEAVLFFGCDHPDVDYLYKEEMKEWESLGAVTVKPAFTFAEEDGVQFVQHRLWKERESVMDLIDSNAKIYVCGDGRRMAPAVRETFLKIYRENKNVSEEEAETWMETLEKTSSRYVTDVFG